MTLTGTKREFAAEFLGTFILIVFGIGSVAQAVFSQTTGNPLSIHLAWGLAVTMGAYMAAGISGAHLNPALTLALAVHRRFPWKKVPAYVTAQFLGAFFASAVVYLVYYEAISHFDSGLRHIDGPLGTAGIWATYPKEFLSNLGGFVDQVLGTALLGCVIFAISDRQNASPPEKIAPVIVGAAVVLIGVTFGYNAGYAINPARDLSPRIFTAIAGWGKGVFSDGWWWVPIAGPCVGAVLGGLIYDLLVSKHHPEPA